MELCRKVNEKINGQNNLFNSDRIRVSRITVKDGERTAARKKRGSEYHRSIWREFETRKVGDAAEVEW